MGSIVNTIGPASALPAKGFNNYLDEGTKISVPFTAIENRAKIINLAADGGIRFGIERVAMQSIVQLQGEYGPNSESVFSVVGDKFDQVRLVGDWQAFNSTYGQYVQVNSPTLDEYVEITFYGTGLNAMLLMDTSRAFTVAVDGGVDTSFGTLITSTSPIANRNYTPNITVNAVSGLLPGIHTVKIKMSSGADFPFYGFEILNESTQLDIRPVAAYIKGEPVSISQTTTDYNSGFTSQYGTPGTKGGNVLVYSDSDGVIHKDIQWTETAQANLGSADHSNEEIIRRINFREFGAARADDFSTLTGAASDRAFTLDDGTTTLVGNSVEAAGFSLNPSGAINSFITLTFVGTGLDIVAPNIGVLGYVIDTLVDGSSVGTLTSANGREKICSGLPYGTHTVKFNTTGGAGLMLSIQDFLIYGPKKPELPANSIELSSYYLMADFVANTNTSVIYLATGVIRKCPTREFTFTGASTLGLSAIRINGHNLSDPTTTTYTFFGTDFEFRFDTQNSACDFTIDIDGSSNLSGFTTNLYGTGVFTPATGNYAGNAGVALGNGISIEGLSLAKHTVTITKNSGVLSIGALDFHTPVHSPKQNKPVIQNALEVGSCALGDLRKFTVIDTEEDAVNWVKAEGVVHLPSTTSSPFVPMPDMSVIYRSNGEYVSITGSACLATDVTGNYGAHTFVVNGKHVGTSVCNLVPNTSYYTSTANEHIMYLEAGVHMIQMFWRSTGGTVTSFNVDGNNINNKGRFLIVKKV